MSNHHFFRPDDFFSLYPRLHQPRRSVISFVRIREIKGKKYRYEETRWRDGKKVRSRSRSLGPVGSFEAVSCLSAQLAQERGPDWYTIEKQMGERQRAEEAKSAALAARLYADFGMKVTPGDPVEIAKPETVVDLSAPVNENAPPGGKAEASGTPGQ